MKLLKLLHASYQCLNCLFWTCVVDGSSETANRSVTFNAHHTALFSEFEELEAMFGQDTSDLAKMEKVMLTQNLEGFASCFPEWDLHPPVGK